MCSRKWISWHGIRGEITSARQLWILIATMWLCHYVLQGNAQQTATQESNLRLQNHPAARSIANIGRTILTRPGKVYRKCIQSPVLNTNKKWGCRSGLGWHVPHNEVSFQSLRASIVEEALFKTSASDMSSSSQYNASGNPNSKPNKGCTNISTLKIYIGKYLFMYCYSTKTISPSISVMSGCFL